MKYKDESWLRETYKDHSMQEMADMIDCSTATLHTYMNKFGIERPDKNTAKGGKHTDKEWLRQKYVDEELSQKEVANIADVGKGTIKYWLDKHDIEIRSKSDAAKIRAERYPHTHGTEHIRDYCWWHTANEEDRKEFREHLSKIRMGENNPMWGKTGPDHHRWKPDKAPHRFYSSKKWQETREKVLERDNHQCQACGKETKLHVHHITPISAGGPRFETNNLVTLCMSHHKEWEGLYLRPDTRGKND